MIIQELYDKITLVNPCRQADFITHLDTTVRALIARYGKKYVLYPQTEYYRPENIQADLPVCEEYMNALYDNILFLLTGDGDRKTEYISDAEDAFKTVWKRVTRGQKFRDSGYKTFV